MIDFKKLAQSAILPAAIILVYSTKPDLGLAIPEVLTGLFIAQFGGEAIENFSNKRFGAAAAATVLAGAILVGGSMLGDTASSVGFAAAFALQQLTATRQEARSSLDSSSVVSV